MAVLFAAVMAVSCAEEIVAPENDINVPEGVASYTAYVEGADTKAVLDGKLSKWQGEESIALVGRKGTHKFTASVEGASSQATFSYAGDGKYDETEVLAVYPYASDTYNGDLDALYVSGVTIQSKQTAVAAQAASPTLTTQS